jgi:luciferase-type oxidoreductase
MTVNTHDNALSSHAGFHRIFGADQLTLGLFFAIESYPGAVPTMADQMRLARRAEELGFDALWVRDVPLLDPSFGDAGQVYDPWVFLGQVATATEHVSLVTGGIVLPLRHPLHVAKAAASVDAISGGRFVLGLAGGDRPAEYPAFGADFPNRAERYRESVSMIRTALRDSFPVTVTSLGTLGGNLDLIPKPPTGLPLLAVGAAGQPLRWLADNLDGFVTYPRPLHVQRSLAESWGSAKPIAQSLYVDLVADPDRPPTPIHLGYRLGSAHLVDVLQALHQVGIAHVVLNLKYGSRPAAEVIEEIGESVLPRLRTRGRSVAS